MPSIYCPEPTRRTDAALARPHWYIRPAKIFGWGVMSLLAWFTAIGAFVTARIAIHFIGGLL